MVHPVGLFGELTSSARVPGRSASSRRSTSSVKPAATVQQRRVVTAAPRIFGISVEVRPQRRHGDDVIARAHQRLHRDHERGHARRGHGDALGAARRRAAGDVLRDRLAQSGMPKFWV
jgi:hypothetical protein